MALLALDTRADLAPVTELFAEVDTVPVGMQPVLGDFRLVDGRRHVAVTAAIVAAASATAGSLALDAKPRHIARRRARMRINEPTGKLRQRQEHVGRDQGSLANL